MTEEDIKIIEKFIDIRNRGLFCDGGQVTEVYNRVLNKNLRPSNCGSCIRQRIGELEVALKAYKKAQEALEKEQVENVPTEENKEAVEAVKRPGRPPKKK